MNCEEVGRWLGPLLDGELDARNASEVQAHLATCPVCKRRYEAQEALSSNMRRLDLAYPAPESLRRRIADALDEPRATRVPRGPARWLRLAGWPVAVAASALLAAVLLQQRSLEADDIVDAHVRSLLVDHLNDVVSTDRHTVKPWFAGKIDFAPPVPDLSSRGFELVGGRLDYLQQPVAAVVYRKHGHIINVLASLPGHDIDSLPHTERVKGYSLRSWRQAGLDLVAISDIDPLELANLEQGYEVPPPQRAEPAGRP
ncbi:MAG: anti-sigma factor family protein [Steroidobacteraceae bacterium]